MPTPEQLIELTFPTKGLDLTTEYQLQPVDTTPVAVNVRAIDPVEHRVRGSSRCGISKYVQQKLGLFSLIQHLNVIVDPTIDAVVDEDEDRWFNRRRRRLARRYRRYIRKGGSGRPLRRRLNPAVANDDTLTANYGGGAVTIFPLSNDVYSGSATFAISADGARKIRAAGASYTITGPVGGWQFSFTAAASRAANKGPSTLVIPYSLRATGNRGKGYAEITITQEVTAIVPGTYPVTITEYGADGDGFYTIKIVFSGALGTSDLWFYSDSFAPEVLEAAANEADTAGAVFIVVSSISIPALGAATLTITGTAATGGYTGSIAN